MSADEPSGPQALSRRIEQLAGDTDEGEAARLAGLVASLREEVHAAAEGSEAALVDARVGLESRLAVLEDTLDAMSERLEALARDGASTTTDRLVALAGSVAALERRLEAQARATADSLRADVVAGLDQAADDSAAARAATLELAETVGTALRSLGDALDRSLSGLGEAVSAAPRSGTGPGQPPDTAERLSAVEAAVERSSGTAQRLADDLSALVDTTDVLGGLVRGLRADLTVALDDVRRRLAGLEAAGSPPSGPAVESSWAPRAGDGPPGPGGREARRWPRT